MTPENRDEGERCSTCRSNDSEIQRLPDRIVRRVNLPRNVRCVDPFHFVPADKAPERRQSVADGDDEKRPTKFASQEAMRFGPRSYTPEQGEVIEQAVRSRRPLPEPPLPIDEGPENRDEGERVENADRYPDECFCSDPNAPYCRVHPKRLLMTRQPESVADGGDAKRFTFPICDICGESTYTCRCDHPENLPPAHPEHFVLASQLKAAEKRAEEAEAMRKAIAAHYELADREGLIHHCGEPMCEANWWLYEAAGLVETGPRMTDRTLHAEVETTRQKANRLQAQVEGLREALERLSIHPLPFGEVHGIIRAALNPDNPEGEG